MTISEVERKTGLSRDTIRYYEKISIISSPQKNQSGYKVYTPRTLKEISFVLAAKELGFSLDEIKPGIQRYFETGRLCKNVRKQVKKKKDFFVQRRRDDLKILNKLDKFMKSLDPA